MTLDESFCCWIKLEESELDVWERRGADRTTGAWFGSVVLYQSVIDLLWWLFLVLDPRRLEPLL